MNYLPFVSWGMYGAATATQRANFWASWGIMASLPGAVASAIVIFMMYYKRLRLS